MFALDWDSILAARGVIGAGIVVTLQVTLVAIAGGTGLAILAVSGSKALQLFARVYVALFRAVPLVTGRRPDHAANAPKWHRYFRALTDCGNSVETGEVTIIRGLSGPVSPA